MSKQHPSVHALFCSVAATIIVVGRHLVTSFDAATLTGSGGCLSRAIVSAASAGWKISETKFGVDSALRQNHADFYQG
jgi:hypothetical protein